MSRAAEGQVLAPPGSASGSHSRPVRGLVATGLLATLVAMAATALAAALARALGVDFEVPEGGGETIPVAGVAVVTGVFSLVGVAIATALLRWSARPVRRFGWTAGSLTALSLVPPVVSGADPASIVSLVALHLVAASVMVPALVQGLRRRAG
jgi:hypothetical protein